MKLLYFGSFSPIHYGHLNQIELSIKKGYDVEIIVSPHNPDKDPDKLIPFDLRVKMIEAGLKELKLDANINLIESQLEKPSYTYITLRKLKEIYGDMAILIGTDSVNNIKNWRNYKEIKKYKFVESIRPGYTRNNDGINIIDQIDGFNAISSTEIRELVKKGEYDKVLEKMPQKSFELWMKK